MNYFKIEKESVISGTGLRSVLWLSGCSHNCYKCYNPQTHDENNGNLFTESTKQYLLDCISNPYIDGITITGGDSLYVNNLKGVLELVISIKEYYPDKNIWLYTGYDFETLKTKFNEYQYILFANGSNEWLTRWEILSYIDVLVDGRYVDELRDLSLAYRGSSNQRILDVQKSLKEGKAICLKL